MLKELREATAALHQKLEEKNLANKIVDHSISEEEYKLLMLQNYMAYSIAEEAISGQVQDYPKEKTSDILDDLSSLGCSNSDLPSFDFAITNAAEAIGAKYVIEGSAMGGIMIGRELEKCPSLQEIPEQQFYSGKRDAVKSWNSFKKHVNAQEYTGEQIEAACKKAVETFQLFQKAYQTNLVSI